MEKSKTGANRSWTTWFEIPVNDMEQAKKFYETVFDIKIDVVDFGGFKMGILPHSDVGGALVEGESYKPSTEGALVYLNANPDLITTQERVEAAGGKVLIEKRQISEEFGYMAVILDSEGNRIALGSDN